MRRRALLRGAFGGALAAALGACGFAPAYGPGGMGAALRGRVAVEAPATEDGTRLRRALEDRLGPAAGPLRLAVEPAVATASSAETPAGAITRHTLTGRAGWRLSEGGRVLAEGVAGASAGYSATGSTVAVRAAEADARARLAAALADAILRRLLLLEGA